MNSVIFILRRSFMDSIVQSIVTALSGKISKELIVFLVSMVPLLELRGSILAAGLMKMSFFPSYIAAVLGNMLPIPFILLFIEKIFAWMKKSKRFHKIPDWLEKKALSNRKIRLSRLIPFCSHSAAGYRCLDRKSYRSIIRYET